MSGYVWCHHSRRMALSRVISASTQTRTDASWCVRCPCRAITLSLTCNRYPQLYQTALAIAYLHRLRIIHGDIKGENILVSEECTALLSDFGVTRPDETPTSLNQKGSGSIPWQSPEILDGKSKSFESDIYAFGMTISEVCTSDCIVLRPSERVRYIGAQRQYPVFRVWPTVINRHSHRHPRQKARETSCYFR